VNDPHRLQSVAAYWERDGLRAALFEALAALDKPLDALGIDDLAPLDQFHGGGKAVTARLARLGALQSGMRVLDVGGGLGGPARVLAVEHGCRVVVLDLAESYVAAGAALTALLGLGDRVTHLAGSALALPFASGAFDIVWTQNSGMNVADKERMVEGFRRVLRPGGRYVFQEPMAGPVQPTHFPLMWADDPATNHLLTPAQMRAVVERAGFAVRAWEDVTAEASGGRAPPHGRSIQSIVMGERLPAIAENGRRNRDEGRVVVVQAVCERGG
jgi:ubiquinone/menaquinone biosynthesis C-methylase UbiE